MKNLLRGRRDLTSYFFRPSIFLPFMPGGGGVTPYNGLYGESPPERGTFLRLQVYTRVGISQVEVYEKVEKSVISVRKRTKKG